MDNESITKEEKIENAVSNIPDEIISFTQSEALTLIVDTIAKELSLSEDQKKKVKSSSLSLLARLKTLQDVYNELIESGTEDELAINICESIRNEILVPASYITEFYTDDVEEDSPETISSDIVKSAPTPSAVLASLGERLSKSNVVAPSVRTYGSETPKPSTPSEPQKRTIDPYREMPEL